MKTTLLHYTKDYHKLVESTARVCYQSYDKVSDTSHKMVKSIMKKGHLSIASNGNIVFGVHFHDDGEVVSAMADIMVFNQINNYLRWTMIDEQKNPNSKFDIVISMNALTLRDIQDNFNEYTSSGILLESILNAVENVPEIMFFLDNDYEIEPSPNEFVLEKPKFNEPIVLAEDYNELKKYLTDYELDYHTVVTVDISTDRAIGLQMWRHANYVGGCELSQRYVSRTDAEYRIPVGLEKDEEALKYHKEIMDKHMVDYENAVKFFEEKGYHKMRAKELARNYLPNIETRIITSRPLRQWKHFFMLRDSSHAQKEMQQDAIALKQAFDKQGIPTE